MISIRSTDVANLKTVAQKMAQIQREMWKTSQFCSPLIQLVGCRVIVMNKLRKYFIAIKMLLKASICKIINCDSNCILKGEQYEYAWNYASGDDIMINIYLTHK